MDAARKPGAGPLAGLRVLEFQGSGPGPFAGMLLADLGADVLLVDRPGPAGMGKYGPRKYETMMRGKRSIALDLKDPQAVQTALQLVDKADALIDVFRPGVMERLGLGPDVCLARNPKLIYGRMTGWGQDGPRAAEAGHDVNYVAVSGVLGAIGGRAAPPAIPLNLVGDMGGGGLLLAFGIVCALLEVKSSGRGQVIDAAMVEGASLLGTLFAGMLAAGRWRDERGVNHLDGAAPWYTTYETLDGQAIAVGANEEPFYAELLRRLQLDAAELPPRQDRARWPALRERIAAVFKTRTRAQWCEAFAGSDACVSPVWSFGEARADPQSVARRSFVEIAGIAQPAPAPRFSRTAAGVPSAPPGRGQGAREALVDWGFDPETAARLTAPAAEG
ncbi:MAG: CaiB/BaiF CoA-transferase family protein [Rubrivivax sp.]